MIISGTISQAGPPSEPTGQWAVRYQDVTITDNTGQIWAGRIGSKMGYSLNTPIQVTVEQKQGNDGPYNYFKKYNPQYQQGQQQNAPQAPSRVAGTSNASKDVDWDAKDLRMARMSGLSNATKLMCILAEMVRQEISSDIIKKCAAEYVDYIYNGIKRKSEQPTAERGQPNPNYVGNNPPPTGDDDIPF